MSLSFIQKMIVNAWSYGLEQLRQSSTLPDPWTLPGMPDYDLGASIPSEVVILLTNAAPWGNATAFIFDASLKGLSELQAKVDPAAPDLDGLTFTPATGIPTSMTCAVTVPSLSLSGSWQINQDLLRKTTDSGCAAPSMLAMAGVEPSDDNVGLLRQVKDDLLSKGGPMGNWYVKAYYDNLATINALLQSSDWQNAVQQYGGNQIWVDILSAIQLAGEGAAPTLSASDLQNALALIGAAQDDSDDDTFVNTLSSILTYLPDYQNRGGTSYTYEQILDIVANQIPPAASPATENDEMPDPAAYNPYYIAPYNWSGPLSASTNASATVSLTITPGEGEDPPTLSFTDLEVTLSDWSMKYSGSDLESKLLVWLQKTFDPSATSGIDSTITKNLPKQQALTFLNIMVNKYLSEYWNNPPSV